MSKNLGNIPREVNMTEEQQQTYTNGFNRGRKAERERILARLEEWKTDDCGNCPRCAANRDIIWIVEGENE